MLGDSVRRRNPQRKPRGPRRARGRGLGVRFWVLGALAALLVPFAVGYVVAAFLLFPAPAVEETVGIPVPALRGMSTVAAERALAQAGLGSLVVTSFPNPRAPEGEIVAQSPLPGQQWRAGADVRVGVSAGLPRALVPDVLGETAERAEQALRRAGFEVVRTDVESAVAAGRVVSLQPAPGSEARLPATVTLSVSLGPPPADSFIMEPQLPPDTVPALR